ncbi:translocation/assembly module TamB domain-containing protein [Elizabethkingia anophelis]|uniref:translocation/assembly module TamB domain-containing protein n=1 Tax=Elizabethkingia anophelis TaxID=1117645 RepID=UPI003891EF63
MANLENNKDNNEKPIEKQIGKAVDKTIDTVSKAVDDAEHFAEDVAKQAIEDASHYSWWAKLLLYLFYIGLGIVGLFFIVVSLPVTKDWAATKALGSLNKDFGIEISKKNVNLNIFGDVTIEGLEIKDHRGFPFIKAKEYRASSDWFSLLDIGSTNTLAFKSMTLKNADVKIITYKGDSIDNFNRFISKFDDGKPRNPNKPMFQLRSRVQILDSKISIVNQNHTGEESKWLTADHFNLTAPLLKVKGPDVSARINNMTFQTVRWGKKHLVETFSTDFSLTKEKLTFKDLTLNTDHSLLMGDLVLNLDKKTHFADFTNKVFWNMTLKLGSQVSGYDISYFVDRWDNYIPINISGKMDGPLNKFTLNNFLVRGKDVKVQTSKMQVKDLLKGKYHITTDQMSADFTYPDLRAMLPKFISGKMGNFADVFQNIKFNGQADVDPHRVIASGNLITGIGQAEIKSVTLSDYSSKEPKYVGDIFVKDLNVTAFTKNKDVGLITGNINVNGQGFDVNTLSLQTKSDIQRIQIMGKDVHNLSLDGNLAQRKYDGLIVINDDQIKGNVKGLIDFSTKRIQADVKSEIEYLNLNYFGNNANANASVSGIFDGKISMTDINDLNLDASLENLKFTSSDQKFEIPNANVKAFFDNGNRVIDVDAPGAAKGKIVGRFNLGDLAGMAQSGLGNVLVGYLPKKIYKGQNFNLEFDVQQKLISYFLPDVYIPSGAHVKGAYIGDTNDLNLDADVPSLKYVMTKKEEIKEADRALARLNPQYKIEEKAVVTDSAVVDSIHLKINTALHQEQILANIQKIKYSKNIVRDIVLKGTNEDDKILHIASTFKVGNESQDASGKLKEYAVNLNQVTNPNGDIAVRFEPTSVKLNKDTWSVDTSAELNHSIVYRKKQGDFLVSNLRLFSEESSILINGMFKGGKDFDTEIKLDNLQLAKVLAFLPGENSMDIRGIANGSAKIKMNKNDLQPIVDIKVEAIKMSGQDVGNLVLNAKNSSAVNVYDIDAHIASDSGVLGDNNLALHGTINNNTPSPTLDLTTSLKDFNIAFAGEFVKSLFSNLRGKANGEVKISGPLSNVDYSGDISMTGLGFKFIFTGVDYNFADAVIPVSKGLVVLDGLKVNDGRANSSGTIAGAINFENLSSLGINLIIQADDLLLLNTSQKDFDTFWGRVTAKGIINISGLSSKLNIDAKAAVLGGSEFTLNTSTASSVEEFKMLRFLKVDEKTGEVSIEQKVNSGANMNIGLILDVDKNSTVNVLVGDNVGNISVRGMANNLRFNMNRTGMMSMNGVYAVDNGTFVSKAILERTFQIEKGSNIAWDGNVMNPYLNIVANYYRVVTNLGEYLTVGKLQPTNVELQIKIKNKMQELNRQGAIAMDIILPDASSQIREALASKLNTEDEKIKQIGSVLIMNSFNVTSSLDGVTIGNAAVSTGYSMLFKNLASVFNAISNDFQIDMDYIKGDQASNTGDRANTSVNLTLSPRVKIKTGIGIPITRTADVQNNYLSGEGSIEYDVSKANDGSLVLHAYSKPANIGLVVGSNASDNQSYGAGVAYTRSFNKFSELFGKKKNKEKKKNKTDNKAVQDSIRK